MQVQEMSDSFLMGRRLLERKENEEILKSWPWKHIVFAQAEIIRSLEGRWFCVQRKEGMEWRWKERQRKRPPTDNRPIDPWTVAEIPLNRVI